jgi:hypothetical protein
VCSAVIALDLHDVDHDLPAEALQVVQAQHDDRVAGGDPVQLGLVADQVLHSRGVAQRPGHLAGQPVERVALDRCLDHVLGPEREHVAGGEFAAGQVGGFRQVDVQLAVWPRLGLAAGLGQCLEPGRRVRRVDDADALVPSGQARAQIPVEQPVPVAVAPVERTDMAARHQADIVDAARHGSGHHPTALCSSALTALAG